MVAGVIVDTTDGPNMTPCAVLIVETSGEPSTGWIQKLLTGGVLGGPPNLSCLISLLCSGCRTTQKEAKELPAANEESHVEENEESHVEAQRHCLSLYNHIAADKTSDENRGIQWHPY